MHKGNEAEALQLYLNGGIRGQFNRKAIERQLRKLSTYQTLDTRTRTISVHS